MQQMLSAVGFRNVTFPPVVRAREVELDQMVAEGWTTKEGIQNMKNSIWIGPKLVKAFLANAVDQLKVIRGAVAQDLELFIIMEDDVLPVVPTSKLLAEIKETVAELPASADVLYLEMCYERCSQLCLSESTLRIARAVSPKCSAAILYTLHGARKFLDLAVPVWAAVDNMLPLLIERGLLEAYVATPPLLVQDRFFGSAASPGKREVLDQPAVHWPVAPPCVEEDYTVEQVGFWLPDVHEPYFSTLLQLSCPSSPQPGEGRVLMYPGLVEKEEMESFDYVTEQHQQSMRRSCWDKGNSKQGASLRMLTTPNDRFCSTRRVCTLYRELQLNETIVFDDTELADYEAAGKLLYSFTLIISQVMVERRSVCFLVHSQGRVDTTGLETSDTAVVVVRSDDDDADSSDPMPTNVREVRLVGASTAMARIVLAEEAVQRFTFPPVRFDAFVFCSAAQVQDGACQTAAQAVRQGLESGPASASAAADSDVEVLSWRAFADRSATWWARADTI
eukprot:3938700-Rhodomonas_salina.6